MFELTIQRFPSDTNNNNNNTEPKALIEMRSINVLYNHRAAQIPTIFHQII